MANEWQPMKMPGHYFSRIARGLARVGDTRLRALGFATAQLPVLSALAEQKQMSQIELARRAKVEQPSMAQLLSRMARDGLVCSEADPADRRSRMISLTKEAQAKLPAARRIIQQGNKEAMRGLSAEEVETLLGLLRRVLVNIEAMED